MFQVPRCCENFAKLSVRKVVKAKASRRYVAVSFDPSFSAVMCCLSNLQFVIAAAKIVLSFQLTYAGLFNLGLIVAVWSNRGFCLLCDVFLHIPCTSGHVRRPRLSTHHYWFLVVLFFSFGIPGCVAVQPGLVDDASVSSAYALMGLSRAVKSICNNVETDLNTSNERLTAHSLTQPPQSLHTNSTFDQPIPVHARDDVFSDDEFDAAIAKNHNHKHPCNHTRNESCVHGHGEKENVPPSGRDHHFLMCESSSSSNLSDNDFVSGPSSSHGTNKKITCTNTKGNGQPTSSQTRTENTLNTPTMSVSLQDINNLKEGETFFVSSVQEVIDHVKQQCKAVNVKASIG